MKRFRLFGPRRGRGAARGGSERGQSLVEFVLALPILLVIVFGIIEFATAWRTYQIITNAAREGARYAVVANGPVTTGSCPSTSVQCHVETYLTNSNLALSRATISWACNGNPNQFCTGAGDAEEVRVDYQHDFVVLGPVLDLMCIGCGTGYGTVTLSSRSVMRQE